MGKYTIKHIRPRAKKFKWVKYTIKHIRPRAKKVTFLINDLSLGMYIE